MPQPPATSRDRQRGLKPWQQVLIWSVTVVAIVSRRPDALLNPQFYAEDGFVWFADAWNLGWFHALALPDGGYLNTLPRLICGLALLVPLKSAPLLLNWFGIALQALPANILLSARCENWGPIGIRALQAATYVCLPNSRELDVTITNAHWHLALAACLLVFGAPPAKSVWKTMDVVVLLLAGLTGPWAIVLMPLVLVFWWLRRQPWSLVTASILAVCALVQAWELVMHSGTGRSTTPLGATLPLFARLVSGQVFLGALWGENSLAASSHLWAALLILGLGAGIFGRALLSLRLEMKLFIAFAILITAAALKSPLIAGNQPRWILLSIDKGGRYWFFPMLAFVWTLLWLAAQKCSRPLRVLSLLCLAPLLRAIPHDWRYRQYEDRNFGHYVKQFNSTKAGTPVAFPIYPSARPMVLVKKE